MQGMHAQRTLAGGAAVRAPANSNSTRGGSGHSPEGKFPRSAPPSLSRGVAVTYPGVQTDGAAHSADVGSADGSYAGRPVAADSNSFAMVPASPGGYVSVTPALPSTGLYANVVYPVTTQFCPPRPPGELPPRVQPPPRPAPVFANDLSVAGSREAEAQTVVSKMWRGVLTRRQLQVSRTHDHILNRRATVIQCWWRTMMAQARHRQLVMLKDAWVASRTADYVGQRVKGLLSVLTWQSSRFEGAAVVIQRVVRWHLRSVARRRCAEEKSLPESQWPAALPFPLAQRKIHYFWWRHGSASAGAQSAPRPSDDATSGDAPAAAPRTLLQFKKERTPVQPPDQETVEARNAEMLQKRQERALALADPEAQSRQLWKKDGLRQEDLDFNAGIIQRRFRTLFSGTQVRTRELTQAYMDRVARTIVRAFRMYITVKHMRERDDTITQNAQEKMREHNLRRIAEVDRQAIWGRELLDACATTIQRCWHWYRYDRYKVLPPPRRHRPQANGTSAAAESESDEAKGPDGPARETEETAVALPPTPPPYNLIRAHRTRQACLRDALLTASERASEEKRRAHRYVRFAPAMPIVRQAPSMFATAS